MVSVYEIKNEVNQKIYIGITSGTLRHRFNGHKNRKRHSYITNAINKYGPENFTIREIIKVNDRSFAEELEIEMISRLNTRDKSIGYNLAPGGMSVGEGKDNPNYDHTLHKFSHKDHGDIFCTKHDLRTKYGLSKSHINELVTGVIKSHKGWRIPGLNLKDLRINETKHKFYHPDHGEISSTQVDLKKKHNLSHGNLIAVIKGRRKRHKGWEYRGDI